MQTAPWKTRTSLLAVAGLLVLSGVFADGRFAAAQTRGDCPLPAGVTASPELPVTAQQVDNGSASLMAFTLAARDQYRALHQGVTTFGESLQIQCLNRQAGSSWHSESTYLVFLTLDGRVFHHAKTMALAGRLLNPLVYGAILEALGIDPADLADPAAAMSALAAAAAGNGGSFNVPDVPGASGYAIVVAGGDSPLVWLAGFDLEAAHLVPIADEDIDYGDPSVTAEEVVDRETLKTFVAEAWDFILGIMHTGDHAALSKIRVALRDENGPWKDDSVYLYVLERTSDVILFHGAFPNRYDFRPLVPLARDAVTGELILPQVLEAATSSPEGGFVVYHFDDPTDDSDSAQAPKVGHAREFILRGPGPDGTIIQNDYIIGSGFYLRPDGEFVQRLLEGVDDGESSMLFAITTPAPGDAVAGNAVAVSVSGAPTDAVHFAYRPAGAQDGGLTYLGAANNRAALAWFAWNTLDMPDGDYELVAVYTEDEGDSVVYDAIEVRVDNAAPAATLDIEEDREGKTQSLRADALHEVVTAAGAMLTVPAGALAGDDRITIAVSDSPDPATAPGDGVGRGIDVGLAGGQEAFLEAVSLSLPYAEGVLDERDIAEGGLSMWFLDPQMDAWELVPGSVVRPDADRVVADVTRPGAYHVFNAAPLLRLEQDGEAVTGLDFGTATEMLSFSVVNGNDTAGRLTWAVDAPEPSWLSVMEAGDTVTVSVNRAGLRPGPYSGTVSVTSNGGNWPVSVSMRVPGGGGGGGGGCAALPVLAGGPPDPTLPALVGLLLVYLMYGRCRPGPPERHWQAGISLAGRRGRFLRYLQHDSYRMAGIRCRGIGHLQGGYRAGAVRADGLRRLQQLFLRPALVCRTLRRHGPGNPVEHDPWQTGP